MVTEFNTDIQTLINQFDAEIGIVNVPYEKKERMTQFEAESKQSDGIARATLWRDTLQRSFDEFNELFGYKGKKKMRQLGSVQVSPEAFMAVLRLDDSND